MKILALDLAGRTGWALWSPGMEAPRWGVAKLRQNSHGQTFADFRDWLTGVVVGEAIEHLAVENVFMSPDSPVAAKKLYGLVAIAEEVAHRRGLSVHLVLVGDWRAQFIGSRNAPRTLPKAQRRAWLKAQARKECARRGWEVQYDDESDALGLLVFERARLFPAFGGDRFQPWLEGVQ